MGLVSNAMRGSDRQRTDFNGEERYDPEAAFCPYFFACPTGSRSAPHVPYSDQPILNAKTTKISDHVWEIMGFPNTTYRRLSPKLSPALQMRRKMLHALS